jgi:hypothetical protein
MTKNTHEALYPPKQMVPDAYLTDEQRLEMKRKKEHAEHVEKLIDDMAEFKGGEGLDNPGIKLMMGMLMNVMGTHVKNSKK